MHIKHVTSGRLWTANHQLRIQDPNRTFGSKHQRQEGTAQGRRFESPKSIFDDFTRRPLLNSQLCWAKVRHKQKILRDEKASARTLRTCNFAPFRNCKPCTPNWKPFAKLPNSNANNGETRPKVGEYNPQVHFSIFYPTPSVKLTITWGQGTPNPKILPDALCEIGNYVGPGPPKTQKDKERLKNFGACTSNM